ncbi:MAG: tetratricopeptide repeat protein, partial [Cyclobacteriaceae bacterium]
MNLRLFLIVLLSQFSMYLSADAQRAEESDYLSKQFLHHLESAKSNPEGLINFIEINKEEIPQLITYLDKTLPKPDSLNYKLSMATNYIYLTSTQVGKYLAEKAYDMAVETKDTTNILFASSALGTVTGEMGEFQEALGYFFRILELSNPEDQYDDYTSALNEIGRLYTYLNDLENAEKYLMQEITLAKTRNDEYTENIGNLNLGVVYMEWGKWDSGLIYMEKSYQYGVKTQDTLIQYNSLGNLAGMYFENNDVQKAIEFQEKGLAFEQMFHDKVAMIDSYANLAMFHDFLN